MGSQSKEPRLVVNELLAYVFFHLDGYPVDNIVNVILQFYHADVISDAKRLLWDCYGDDLPSMQKRTNKGHKSAAEKDIEDVMDSVKLIDAKYSDKDVYLPTVFVAANLSKLPNVTPGEIEVLSLLERVSCLERQMIQVCAPQKQTYASVASPPHSGAKTAARTASVTNAFSGTRPKDTSTSAYVMPLTVALPPVPGDQATAAAPDDGFTLQPAQLKRQRRQQNMDSVNKYDTDTRTRSKPKVVYGTRQSSTLRAGPRRHDLFVFRVDNDITDEMLQDYLKDNHVTVRELECISQDGSWTKSYRITVECNDISGILNPEFWPDGIGCRRFRRKRVIIH